jgi:prepilin-type N-terminal cleavage/methylation domain-containing protein
MDRRQRGFTLIELLVVIAIIGILATLVITQLASATVKARNSSAQSDATEAGKGIAAFAQDDTAGGAVIATAAGAFTDSLKGSAGQTGSQTPPGGSAVIQQNKLTAYFTGTQSTTSPLTYATALNKTPSTNYIYWYKAGTATDTTEGILTGSVSPSYAFCVNIKSTTGGTDTYFEATQAGTSANTLTSCP